MREKEIQDLLKLMRKRVGTIEHFCVEQPNELGRGIEIATRDAIRSFAKGIGDVNPL